MRPSTVAIADESERAVLGAVLYDPSVARWLELDADHFAVPQNAAVWSAVQAVVASDRDVDLTLLEAELRRTGHLAAVGLDYLGELATAAFTASNVEAYADELRRCRTARRVVDLAASCDRWVRDGLVGDELLDQLTGAVAGLEGSSRRKGLSLVQLIRAEHDAIDEHLRARESGQLLPGVATGIRRLDEDTGGIPIGLPTLLASRPGEGKSTLAQAWGRAAVMRGEGVHWFSNEDGHETFAQRWLASLTGIDSSAIRRREFGPGQFRQMSEAEAIVRDTVDCLLWEQAVGQDARWICRRMRAEQRRLNTRLVVVDLLARVRAPLPGMDLRSKIAANLETLSACAAELRVALLMLAHTKRGQDSDPHIDDLAECDFLGRDCKLVMQLRRTETGDLDVWVTKNHQGRAGIAYTIRFEPATGRISNEVPF